MHPLLIADRRPTGQGAMRIVEPAHGAPFDEVATAGPADLEAAVAAAKTAFPSWAKSTAVARAEVLFRFADLVRAHADELATLEARNVGKPIGDARWEAGHVADTLRYYAGAADKFFGQTIAVKKGGLDVTLHDPLGVVGLIVGGVGVGAGITLFVLSSGHSDKAATLSPWVGPTSAGVRGTF